MTRFAINTCRLTHRSCVRRTRSLFFYCALGPLEECCCEVVVVRVAVPSMGEILPWLREAIAHFYPGSTYAKSLDPHIRENAARRLFRPPTSGAQVRCPHCGAPNAAPPGMEGLIAFTCLHCGQGVELPPPQVS
jgi:hypothetical protein